MTKILFIKDGLSIGGTTTSFLALMNVLKNRSEYEVYVWVNGPGKERLPSFVKTIRHEGLEGAFRRKTGIIGKCADLLRYRQIGLHIRARRRAGKESRDLMPIYQEMDIRRAKKQNKIDLTEYDAVITWEELFPAYLLAEKIQARKKIAWIHPDYQQCGFSAKLDAPSFERLDAIVAVSEQGKTSMQQALPNQSKKMKCVGNYVNIAEMKAKAEESKTEMDSTVFSIVTVARIQNISKALDRAVRVAGRLRDEGFRFKWYLVGDGEDYASIREMVLSRKLEDCVILLGAKRNPYPYILNADLFVLQSYYEGKPMTVDEALILGTPVFVTNYMSAREQIDEAYGWIVDNSEDAIVRGLKRILSEPSMAKEKRDHLKRLDVEKYTNSEPFARMMSEVLAR